MEDLDKLSIITQSVCEVCGVTMEQIMDRKKYRRVCDARGIIYMIARREGIHPKVTGDFLERKRCVAIIMASRFEGYIKVGDKYIISLHERVLKLIAAKERKYEQQPVHS